MTKEDFLKAITLSVKYIDKTYKSLSEEEQVNLLKDLEKLTKKIKEVRNAKDENASLIFRFGRFRGTAIIDTPAWYLLWCYEQAWFKEHNKDMYAYIKSNIKKLKKQKEEDDKEIEDN